MWTICSNWNAILLIFLSVLYSWFLSSLRLWSKKAWHRENDLGPVAATAAAALANFLKALYFRRWKTWMLHTLHIDSSCHEVSISHLSNVLDWPHFHGSVTTWKKVKIFCNVKFSLIISNRITIFGMCVPCKVLMPVRHFLLDLVLISWIIEQG